MKTSHAARMFGSKTNLAKAIEISPNAVFRWGDEVPARQIKKIKAALVRKIKIDMDNLNETFIA